MACGLPKVMPEVSVAGVTLPGNRKPAAKAIVLSG